MRGGLRQDGLVIALLLVLVWAVFGGAVRYAFVGYDDPVYVLENPLVKNGWSWGGALQAFTSLRGNNWHPLAWISHMLDVEFFGLNPGRHHAVNIALHVLVSTGVFLVLASLTGRRWPSAFAAALFAVHPLHVESVVWISERKDLLSALFFTAGVGAYLRYVRRPGPGRYLALLALFILAGLAKPMAVTFPAVLLLLDFWPLARWAPAASAGAPRTTLPAAAGRVLAEKVPLLLVSLALAWVTLRAQSHAALQSLETYPLAWRVENALWSYAWYLGKIFWPSDLAVFYPHPKGSLVWESVAAGLLLAAAALLAARQLRARPWGAVGGLWFFGMLLPVIGLIQVGSQARADRYTYLPSIGIFLVLAWGAGEVARRGRRSRAAAIALAAAALLLLSVAARQQVGSWRDTVSLFERALAVTEGNYVAHGMLGYALVLEGRLPEAVPHFYLCLLLDPGNLVARRYVEGNRGLLPPGAVIPPLPAVVPRHGGAGR